MPKHFSYITFILTFNFGWLFIGDVSAGDRVENQIIVALKMDKNIESIISFIDQKGTGVTGLHVVRPLSKQMNIWLLECSNGVDENELLHQIRNDQDVTAAQFNYFLKTRNTPNDPLFVNEWDFNNTGQSSGLAGADIDALLAWDITTGGLTAQGDTIVVAVVDCGFYLSHLDLDFWKNYGEIPNNGLDDDNNGYVDDFDGWNGFGNSSITSCAHGTHVSGTIGARGNNNTGVAGVNWNVKAMPLQYGNGDDAGAIESYGYAFAMRRLYNQTNGLQGAFIVATNSSFGIDYGLPADHPLWCSMYDSLGSVGILSAGAGPNLNINIDVSSDIPTACPSDWLISVTNTTRTDLRNGGAGFGPINMDIGAPGTSIWSTVLNNQYSGSYTGTSMATPHVSGAVALMWSAACTEMVAEYKSNPSALAFAMKNIMLNQVDTIASLDAVTLSHGRLNLYKSLLGVQNYCASLGMDEHHNKNSVVSIFPNPVQETCNIYYPSASSDNTITLKLFDSLGRQIQTEKMIFSPFVMNTSELKQGVYFLQIDMGKETLMKKLIKD